MARIIIQKGRFSDIQDQIRDAWKNGECFVVIKPRKKYGLVWWNSDPAYPYYNSERYLGTAVFQKIHDMVEYYSLGDSYHGIPGGVVEKISLEHIYEFAEQLKAFLETHIIPVDITNLPTPGGARK